MRGTVKYGAIAVALILLVTIPVSVYIFLGNNQDGIQAGIDESKLLPEICNYTVQNNIRYVSDSSPYHLMDAYIPEGKGPFPAIIYIHGGGWVEGSRSDFNNTASLYAKRGIAGFSIDYTLSQTNNTAWPENIRDVVRALSFIRENSATYKINVSQIAVMGSSAGAQLGSLLGTLSGNEAFLGNLSGKAELKSQVCLVIDYSGPTDLQYIGEKKEASFIYRIVRDAFGNTAYKENPSLWIEASPATYVAKGDPIFVLIHGIDDVWVPIDVAELFNSKLQAAGVQSYLFKIDGAHDILTSDIMNLQARLQFEPILKQVFNLNSTA